MLRTCKVDGFMGMNAMGGVEREVSRVGEETVLGHLCFVAGDASRKSVTWW